MLVLTLIAFIVLTPSSALCCACCAYPGQWSTTTRDIPSDPDMREWFVTGLSAFRLSGSLQAAAGEKDSPILKVTYEVSGSYSDGRWLFFRTDSASTDPLLQFQTDKSYEEFKSDQGRRTNDGYVELYKEWRFFGTLESFSNRVPVRTGSDAILVLQGYGNNCVRFEDFKHWILVFHVQEYGLIENAVIEGEVDTQNYEYPLMH